MQHLEQLGLTIAELVSAIAGLVNSANYLA
jgi:hypothetical protein